MIFTRRKYVKFNFFLLTWNLIKLSNKDIYLDKLLRNVTQKDKYQCHFYLLQHSQKQKSMNMNKASIMSRERKVTFLVLLLLFAFMVAWAPYATICLLRLIQGIKPTPATVAISMLCAKTSACINPIIFTLFNAQVNQLSFLWYPYSFVNCVLDYQ